MSSVFCRGFIILWSIFLKDDSLWHRTKEPPCKSSPVVLSLSISAFSSLCRASALWPLPSCISSSWRPSAGCWQRRGSPTWPSLAKWGHDSSASVFCASAGVSVHNNTHDHTQRLPSDFCIWLFRLGLKKKSVTPGNKVLVVIVKELVLETQLDFSHG